MTKIKHLTPLKAIREFCLFCSNQQPKEIRLCPSGGCPFYDFRMGKKTRDGSLMKAIRERCLDCGEGTPQAIRKCEFPECSLFIFRNGTNPHRKGIGGTIHKTMQVDKKGA